MTVDRRNPDLLSAVELARNRCGREPLDDRDLLLLALEEISRSRTYDELNSLDFRGDADRHNPA